MRLYTALAVLVALLAAPAAVHPGDALSVALVSGTCITIDPGLGAPSVTVCTP